MSYYAANSFDGRRGRGVWAGQHRAGAGSARGPQGYLGSGAGYQASGSGNSGYQASSGGRGHGYQARPQSLALHRARRGPPKRCELCSYHQPPPEVKSAVYHFHFSAKQVRRLAGVEDKGGVYLCPTCGDKGTPGVMHAANNSERLKICLSSSTLHEFWMEAGYGGDQLHIDWVTSPSATIQSLENMFLAV